MGVDREPIIIRTTTARGNNGGSIRKIGVIHILDGNPVIRTERGLLHFPKRLIGEAVVPSSVSTPEGVNQQASADERMKAGSTDVQLRPGPEQFHNIPEISIFTPETHNNTSS